MGQQTPNILGRNQRFYAARESTFGTAATIAGTNALKVLKSSITYKQELRPRMDARASAGVFYQTPGMWNGEWNAEMYILPSGTVGTPPNAHPLLLSTLGGYTNVASTSDTYVPNDNQGVSSATVGTGSMTIVREFNAISRQRLLGAAVDKMSIAVRAGDEPKFTFSGFFAQEDFTATTTLSAQATSSATTLSVAAADQYNFMVGSLVQVGADNNTGAGYTVTAVSSGSLTITPGMASTVASGSVVAPFAPTETTAGVPISYTSGSITFDNQSALLPLLSADLEYSNNAKKYTDQAFNLYLPDYSLGFRDIKLSLQVKGRRGVGGLMGRYQNLIGTTRQVTLVCGAAGARMTITVPNFQPTAVDLDVPGAEEGVFKVEGICLSTTGSDDVSIAFT